MAAVSDDIFTRLIEVYEANPSSGNALVIGFVIGLGMGWTARGKMADDSADVQINQNNNLSVSDVIHIVKSETISNANDIKRLNEQLRKREEMLLQMVASATQDQLIFEGNEVVDLPRDLPTQPIIYPGEDDNEQIQTRPTRPDHYDISDALRRYRERTRREQRGD
jgi:hypothetical protein